MILTADERKALRRLLTSDVSPKLLDLIIEGAGLNTGRIDLDGPYEIRWQNVLSEAERQGTATLGRLLSAVVEHSADLLEKIRPLVQRPLPDWPNTPGAPGDATPSSTGNQTSEKKGMLPTVSPPQGEGPIKILFLSANPLTTDELRLGHELRDIQNGLERAKLRDRFSLVSRFAVSPRDLLRAVLEIRPTILHFSGHAEKGKGILLEDESGMAKQVNGTQLAQLFALTKDYLRCVILNACYAADQADAIAQHVPYVIGMKTKISDPAATEFAVGFYDGLGRGEDYEQAFEQARVLVALSFSHPEFEPPILTRRPSPS